MTLHDAVGQALGLVVDGRLVDLQSIRGGDICTAYRATLADGRVLFAKTHPRGEAMFATEADGLRWLAAAAAIRTPAVVAVAGDPLPLLVLEFVDTATPAGTYDEQLGQSLARLHAAGSDAFGGLAPNFIGTLGQDNRPEPTWPAFYRARRLLPLTRRGFDRGLLDSGTSRSLERVCTKLEDLCGPPEAPARLHGDLWSGNVIADEHGAPVLVDPSAYGGHREIDLAMMALFGRVSERTLAAYDEVWPRAPGAARRIPLYQLYPLLVHVNLFGGSYVAQLRDCIRALD